ncbi:universal stress protein [Nakamurella sp.]|uniref:universal stress protein n=1 Tax=Nakamurella sp. TaxID=1869182 RepID=UPI00378465D5
MVVEGVSITVGVDGSVESLTAAHWAAKEAEIRRLPLHVVLAMNEPVAGHSDYVFPPAVLAAARSVNRARLDRAASFLRDLHPDLDVHTDLESADPRRALVAGSKDTALTVVGCRGRGRLAEVLIGSVALHVAAHAHSPVAVVPPATDLSVDGRDRPVLLGVDGGSSGSAAIGYGFEEAAVRATRLQAVLVLDDTEPWLADEGRAPRRPTLDRALALLSEQLAPWEGKYPSVPVDQIVRRGRPAPALLECLAHGPVRDRPGLFVVGSRGRGGLAGLLLGSTSQQLIARGTVPVIVVRPEGGD